LTNGESQIIDEVPPAKVESMQSNSKFSVLGAPKVGMARGIHFNIEYAPTDDKLVRMAFLHAINRDEMDKAVFKGVYPLSYQVLTRGVKFYNSSLESMYPYDPEKSKSLLDQAGWSKINSDGFRTKNGKVLSLFHATFPGYVAEAPAEVLQAQLKRVGIKFDINVMSGTAMMDGMTSRESTFNTALVGTYSPDPGLFLKKIYHSSAMGTFNFSHYTTPELDKLLDDGLKTTSDGERGVIYAKIQKIIMEEAIVGGLYANASIFGTSMKVKGFKFDPYAQPEIFDVHFK
jgi:peptide/nickel transport system substrate-binding protein